MFKGTKHGAQPWWLLDTWQLLTSVATPATVPLFPGHVSRVYFKGDLKRSLPQYVASLEWSSPQPSGCPRVPAELVKGPSD